MGKITLEDIEVYAYHGYYTEEQKTGGKFVVNLEMDVDFEDACISDDLNDTYNYQHAYDVVMYEMKNTSALLEHIAARIADKIMKESLKVNKVSVYIAKVNPPLGGQVKSVGVEITKTREG